MYKAINSFFNISITFLSEVLQLNGVEIGIIFVMVYVSALPGAIIFSFVSKRMNPIFTWKACLILFFLSIIVAGFVLTGPEAKNISYPFFILLGVLFGGSIPTRNLIFSMCVPKDQAAELSGFFVYCRQIFTWVPPLVFTSINESGIHMKYGLMSLSIFFFIAWMFLMFMDQWSSISLPVETTDERSKKETGTELELMERA